MLNLKTVSMKKLGFLFDMCEKFITVVGKLVFVMWGFEASGFQMIK
jgi:hypothetical protein